MTVNGSHISQLEPQSKALFLFTIVRGSRGDSEANCARVSNDRYSLCCDFLAGIVPV
jgi:hypothetical protein